MTRDFTHILLADDDDIFRSEARRGLVEGGYRVDCAGDLRETSRLLSDREYDLMLVDPEMERSRVVDLVRLRQRLHQSSTRPPTPMIFVTANPSIATAVDAVRLDALDYLHKPLSTRELLACIARAMKRRRASRELASAQREIQVLKSALQKLTTPPPGTHEGTEKAYERLTRRQREVIELVRRGMSTAQIAHRFELSPHTVRNHLKKTYKKFEVKSRPALMQKLLRMNEALA